MLNSRVVLIGFCSLCAGIRLGAQDCHIALRGHVLEADTKEPLAYATVTIQGTGKGAITDEDGFFTVPNLCDNTSYTVEVSHVECAHQTQQIRLTENATIDFKLLHDNVLGEVVILEKAVAPQAAQAESKVSQADLEATQGVNLGETLKKLPGVTTLNTGATIAKPVIQGLHSNRIAIVSNNVILEGQQWGSEHAPEVDPFAASVIKVVKGAAGVRYGVGAMGGAVILEPAPLRAKPGTAGWVSLGGFSNGFGGVGSGAIDWHLKDKTLAFRLQGTAKRSGNLRAPDYWLANTGASELNLALISTWRTKRWNFDANASIFSQQLGILRAAHIGNLTDLQLAINSPVPLNNKDAFTYDIARPYQRVQHYLFKYRAAFQLNDRWKWTTQYAGQFNNRREYDVLRSTTQNQSTTPQLSFRIWTNTLDMSLEHVPIHHWQGGIGVQTIQQTNLVGRGGLIPDYLTLGGSVWAMERWRRFPSPWEFEAGARYDYRWSHVTSDGNFKDNIDTTLHFGNASGTLGLIYHFTKNLDATLNSGFAWRPPHINELFARGVHHGAGTFEQGRRDLSPEKAWNTNLTLQYQNKRTEATLTVYRNQIQDFIFLNPQKEFVLTVRGAFPAYHYEQANAVLQGLDGSFSVPIDRHWSVESRISLLRGQRSGAYTGENGITVAQEWLPLMPTDRFQYGVKWELGERKNSPKAQPGAATYIRVLATSALRQTRFPAEGLVKAPPAAYTTLSFDAAHTFYVHGHQPLEVGLTAQNLTNLRYREYLNFFRYYADEPGVNVGVRAKWIF